MAEKKKLTLALCTGGKRLKAGLLSERGYYCVDLAEPNQEKALFPALDRLLARAGAELDALEEVLAVRGPGRFTGIRIGLTFAGTLSLLLGCRAGAVTAFETLSFACSPLLPAGGRLAVLLHAFKEEYFLQFFRAVPGGRAPRPEGGPAWLAAEEVRAALERERPDLCAADSEEAPAVYSLLPPGVRRAPARISRLTPAAVIAAGAAFCGPLEPLYLKPAKYELAKPSGGPGKRGA